MSAEYSIQTIRELEDGFKGLELHRPMRPARYEPDTELEYQVESTQEGTKARVRLRIQKFIGGGYAGQVYRVELLEIDTKTGSLPGLRVGNLYAMKILIPPSGFSRFFRDLLYLIGFQGPFQLQVNPAAARSGALWQKLIRKAAAIRFGDERAIRDIHGVFVDYTLGSCGEISDWIEGRNWKLEVDDHIDTLKAWSKGKPVDEKVLGSPEFRAKKVFMRDLVSLLHKLGAHEFARQYEWSTWKSQPNCLKYSDTDHLPSEGLVAADFRAGLTLLPFLPMSPGDIRLIFLGLFRGSLVQFDRGDVEKLDMFIEKNRHEFFDLLPLLAKLKEDDKIYRDSIPDITHNHLRLLYDRKLWSTMLDSAITGWKVEGMIDEPHQQKLMEKPLTAHLFKCIGIIPLLGGVLRKAWGQPVWRRHYKSLLSQPGYLRRAFKGKVMEKLIAWHRAGRVDAEHTKKLVEQPVRFLVHVPLSVLPTGLHRLFTDWSYAKERMDYLFARPVRLYFNSQEREQWLRDMVEEGRKDNLIHEEDEREILSQLNEPFIQKYLKCLAVHVCTVPITQVVSLIIAGIYLLTHPEVPRAQAYSIALGIIALFQVVPLSPGSLVRGLYVLYLVIRERNFKDYNIAVFLAFFKYIGYLAFPIQMSYRYPTLARFMAVHWATDAVHIVPVFGEKGALLEHTVFRMFYNWPLTIRRRMNARAQLRKLLKPRYWHIPVCAATGALVLGVAETLYFGFTQTLPGLKDIWWMAVLVPGLCGTAVTAWAGGAAMKRRVIAGALCGMGTGMLYAAFTGVFNAPDAQIGDLAVTGIWRMFVFSIMSVAGVLLTELNLPEPH